MKHFTGDSPRRCYGPSPERKMGHLDSPGPVVLHEGERGIQTALDQMRPVGREESVSFPRAPSSSQVPDTWLEPDRGLLVLSAFFKFSPELVIYVAEQVAPN